MSGADRIGKAEFRAGGTDLSERRRSGLSRGAIIDLEPSDEMTRIAWSDDGAARIGALVTIETIAADARLVQAYPGLAAAAGGLATPQIRAVGTIGGNLAQRNRCWYYRNPHLNCLKKGGAACPARSGNHLYGVAFDLGPCVAPHPSTLGVALLAYEAVATTDRRADLVMAALFGDGRNGTADNALAVGEQILSVALGAPVSGERALYRRATSRAFAEWPLVEIVVRAVIEHGRCQFIRVAAGGVAPVPLRLPSVEEALASRTLDPATIRAAAVLAIKGAKPLPQTAYKLHLLQEQLVDVLESVAL
jgi:xanthine dehydrogenase YagS FAD-binding subunit